MFIEETLAYVLRSMFIGEEHGHVSTADNEPKGQPTNGKIADTTLNSTWSFEVHKYAWKNNKDVSSAFRESGQHTMEITKICSTPVYRKGSVRLWQIKEMSEHKKDPNVINDFFKNFNTIYICWWSYVKLNYTPNQNKLMAYCNNYNKYHFAHRLLLHRKL